jgi:hypothetical protein
VGRVAKVWKVTFGYRNLGQDCDLGLHYQWDGTVGANEATAQEVATAIDSHLSAAMADMIRNTGSLETVTAREEVAHPGVDVPSLYIKNHHLNGGLASGAEGQAPPEMCALLHRRTEGAIRGAQSWCFTPSPSGGAGVVGGLWDSASGPYGKWAAFVALLDDEFDETTGPFALGGKLKPVAYLRHRRSLGQTPYTFAVKSAAIDAKPRWLRSRSA